MIRSMKSIVPAAVAALAMGGTTQADVIKGTSDAFTAQIGVLGFSLPAYGNLAPEIAPPVYDTDITPATLSVNVPFVISATSGALKNSIFSDVDGGLGSRMTTADSELANASITVLPSLFGPPAFSVSVDAIHQNATASGDFGSASATSTLSIENLVVQIGGAQVYTFSGVLNTQQNINLAPGVTLALNEQTSILDVGTGTLGISSNALHLRFGETAELILGHATAVQQYAEGAVPEPASIAMLGLGVVGAGLAGLRRRKAA
jgi:hypothetical protein